jgi:thiol-disulfide isomerase/thioredoxin
MTDTGQTPKSRAPSGLFKRVALGLGAAVAVLGVLYGTMPQIGKESAGACAASADAARRIAPYARGEVASLVVAKNPTPAVPIAFDGPDGARLGLENFRGKAVLVNLWATWCLPCRAEMPALDRLQAKLGGDAFEVVTINIDTARLERREAFWKETGLSSLTFYSDQKADVFQTLKRAGKAVGLPTTLLIDSKGCEVGVMAGPAEWDSEDAVRLVSTLLDK